jgi:hypothetical protein
MKQVWFDQKYKNGGEAALKDIEEVFKGQRLHIPEREKRDLIKKLNDNISALTAEYSPSIHLELSVYLNCFRYFLEISDNEKEDLLKRYKKAISKYPRETIMDVCCKEEF